jgi:hypothetical protein
MEGEFTGALGEMPNILALRRLMVSGVASVLSEGYKAGTSSLALRYREAVSMSCGENFPGDRFSMGLGLRLLDVVVPNGSGLNLLSDGCWPHSSANRCRLGLGELLTTISGGSDEKWAFVLWLVSIGSGANLRLVLCVVSTGSGANLRFVLALVSIGSGANLRFVFVVVSTGSGANLRTGLGLSAGTSTCLSFDDDVDVSIGWTLNRLGGPFGAMVYISFCTGSQCLIFYPTYRYDLQSV